jgi:phospholipid/cholesterol/gamma-HCH transport system substrate-binding protein
VRLAGIDIGVVDEIRLPDVPGGHVVVAMRLDRDARHLIKKDAFAVIETEGLVGNRIVALKGGSLNAPHVAAGDSIRSRSPIDLTAILESFDATARYMELVTQSLDGITSQIRSGKGTIGKLVFEQEFYDRFVTMTARSDSVFAALFDETRKLGSIITRVSESTDSLITRVRAGKGTLGALIYGDDLHDLAIARVGQISDSLQQLVAEARGGRGLMGKMVSDETLAMQLDSSLHRLAQLNQELNDVSRIARAGVFSFAENMEALKHNWFFKGYFEQRGFWNRAEFEKNYEQRKQELAAQEKRLQEREKILQEQYQQVRQLQKLLESRSAEVEKRETQRQQKKP